MLAGVPAAYALARLEFRGRKLFLDLILITQMFSPVVLLIPLFRLYNELGMLGTLEGVIIAGSAFTLPFSIWLLTGFFRAIPVEIEEAARIDGYGRLGDPVPDHPAALRSRAWSRPRCTPSSSAGTSSSSR